MPATKKDSKPKKAVKKDSKPKKAVKKIFYGLTVYNLLKSLSERNN